MDTKYLPIGTIVELSNFNKKVMIDGYYSVEYRNNSIKIYDYSGTIYPEGLLVKNNSVSFNHSDIAKVDFKGYEEESFKALNQQLNNQSAGEAKAAPAQEPKKENTNFSFNANGEVVYEYADDDQNKILTDDNPVVGDNPFKVTASKIEENSAPAVKPKYKFDSSAVEEDTDAKKDLEDINSNFVFTFDENGNVVEETVVDPDAESEEENGVDVTFDENGNVISETPKKKGEQSA